MGIAFSVDAKGPGGVVKRAGTILSRFGPTQGPMAQRLVAYAELTGEFGARPTLPVTARVLARHPALFRDGVERGVEFAAHGLVHNDHAGLDPATQRESIGRAVAIFKAAGVPCAGFRGPYLRFNAGTEAAVRAAGLLYHSSQAISFGVLPVEQLSESAFDGYQRALRLYSALPADRVVVRPRYDAGLIDIPIALPDDEIMVDRLGLGAAEQAAAWLAILEQTAERGELFTMQLHPERIFDCGAALRAVLVEARQRQPAVWIARLDEIAGWWQRRRQGRLTVEAAGEQRYRVHVEGISGATLLLRGLPEVRGEVWYGRDRRAAADDLMVEAAVNPVLGLSTRTSKAAREFLIEEGFPVDISDDRDRFGVHLDLPEAELNEQAILDAIDRSDGPLVRLWRWPDGARSALAVTGDIDSITVQDFALRLWETR